MQERWLYNGIIAQCVVDGKPYILCQVHFIYCAYSLLQEHGESIVHMLPFMLPIERDDALGEFYKRVKEAMEKIHELNQEGTEELKEIAAEW